MSKVLESNCSYNQPIVEPFCPLNKHLIPLSKLLHEKGIPLILWGENAMKQHGIPAAVLRDDMVVPSDRLDEAASTLLENGYRYSTGKLPISHAPFWRTGWHYIASICRRFKYPLSFGLEYDEEFYFELLLLPTTFVRWDLEPLNDQDKFVRIAENIFCPSAHVMAASIVRAFLHHPERETSAFAILMVSWASYYRHYAGFGLDMLDGYAEEELEEWWHEYTLPPVLRKGGSGLNIGE